MLVICAHNLYIYIQVSGTHSATLLLHTSPIPVVLTR